MWGWSSYDPELDLIFYGTANPGPWNPEQHPGDNKWTCGLFARDPDTGEARWFSQWSPHDLHDYDGINENLLLDLPLKGQMRKVLVHPERNGYVSVLDRATGQVLSATPFVYLTSQLGKVVREIRPAAPGAKDWQPSAFSPPTGWLDLPPPRR